jgi:hypothetical protein
MQHLEGDCNKVISLCRDNACVQFEYDRTMDIPTVFCSSHHEVVKKCQIETERTSSPLITTDASIKFCNSRDSTEHCPGYSVESSHPPCQTSIVDEEQTIVYNNTNNLVETFSNIICPELIQSQPSNEEELDESKTDFTNSSFILPLSSVSIEKIPGNVIVDSTDLQQLQEYNDKERDQASIVPLNTAVVALIPSVYHEHQKEIDRRQEITTKASLEFVDFVESSNPHLAKQSDYVSTDLPCVLSEPQGISKHDEERKEKEESEQVTQTDFILNLIVSFDSQYQNDEGEQERTNLTTDDVHVSSALNSIPSLERQDLSPFVPINLHPDTERASTLSIGTFTREEPIVPNSQNQALLSDDRSKVIVASAADIGSFPLIDFSHHIQQDYKSDGDLMTQSKIRIQTNPSSRFKRSNISQILKEER